MILKKKNKFNIILNEIDKLYGKGTVLHFGKMIKKKISTISTGSMILDIALGIGGYPKGRIIEIFGSESSGKTTLALHAIVECQKNGGNCAFIDVEHSLDINYAKKIGININCLTFSQPNSGEQALEVSNILIESKFINLIVIDSVASLIPKAEIEGNIGNNHIGLQARLMSQALRKLIINISKTNTILIFTNQIRIKIGLIFGNSETTAGGNALKFYSSVRIEMKKTAIIKNNEYIIGNSTKVKIVKNKLSSPLKIIELDFIYGNGITYINEILNLAILINILKKSGFWYFYKNTKIAQGKINMRHYLINNHRLFYLVKEHIIRLFNKEKL